MKQKLKVLSLFDGMSCGQIALQRLGYSFDKGNLEYYASEIHEPSIKVTQHNFPNTIQLGDGTKVSYKDGVIFSDNGNFDVGSVDLVIGGSPCQSISNLGKQEGLAGKSGLFFHWLRIRDEVSPKAWLLENVVGNKNAIQTISDLLGTQPTLINSNLVSAQNRKRLYWTNKDDLILPSDKGLYLKDILDSTIKPEAILTEGRLRWLLSDKGQACLKKRYATLNPLRAGCLTARSDASWNCNYITREGEYYKLSCEEYEKLQTVPVGYTSISKPKDRYAMLGNGWTVDVIVHLLKQLLI